MPLSVAEIVDYAGVAVFAVSGALAAARRGLDLLGVIVIAMVTAIGGGTVRDVLLDRQVFWIVHSAYLWVILAAAFGTIVWTRRFTPPERALVVADALGLAFFTISGARIAEGLEHRGIVVVLMGTLTGVAGGVLRDVLSAEIPLVFRRGQIYATAAIAGAALYLALKPYVPTEMAAFAGMACIAAIRFAAIAWNWQLPVYGIDRKAPPGPPL
jgi:uncharacterized membrane protein YeiH